MTIFLSTEDVVKIHARMLEEYGGQDGLRDLSLLESAVAQPMASFGGELLHSSIFEMAAAYLFHIIKNHPFFDGNKRTGLTAALMFLEINGIELETKPGETSDLAVAVATDVLGKEEVAAFFQSRTK